MYIYVAQKKEIKAMVPKKKGLLLITHNGKKEIKLIARYVKKSSHSSYLGTECLESVLLA